MSTNPALRARALLLLQQGQQPSEVAAALGITRQAVWAWQQNAIRDGELDRPAPRDKGSGEITPPYRRGCVWGAG